MANTIHPSATIGPTARLGDGNDIGPNCVIDNGVVLGSNNRLWMNVYIGPGTTIGDANQFHMGAVIGHTPQDLAYAGAPTQTTIGHRNTFREYVTIHRGTKEGSATVVGDENYLMANAHLAHNCHIGNSVIMANAAALAGYCVVEDGAFISGMVAVHQFVRIGRLAMISGLSGVPKDVPPFMLCAGQRAVIRGLNVVGIRRAGIKAPIREELKRVHRLLYREGLSVPSAIEAIEQSCSSPEALEIDRFVKASKRGISAGVSEHEQDAQPDEPLLPTTEH